MLIYLQHVCMQGLLLFNPEHIRCCVSDPEDKSAAYFKTLQKPAGDLLSKTPLIIQKKRFETVLSAF